MRANEHTGQWKNRPTLPVLIILYHRGSVHFHSTVVDVCVATIAHVQRTYTLRIVTC